jgi:hypothetical protein
MAEEFRYKKIEGSIEELFRFTICQKIGNGLSGPKTPPNRGYEMDIQILSSPVFSLLFSISIAPKSIHIHR